MPRALNCSLLLVGLIAATACAPRAPTTAQGDGPSAPPRADRTLLMAVRAEPASIAAKPSQSTGVGLKASTRLFNAGLDLVDDRNIAHPYLAEGLPQLNTDSWRVLPDGRMETVYRLRPNLTWHDGTPFTAADMAFAWRVYATPELGASSSLPIVHMEEVLAPDPRTVVIRWKRLYPQAGVLQATGNCCYFPPVPRHILEGPYQEGQWDAFANHPYWTREFIGLGPYRLERWDAGSSLEGSAFDGHVLGRPKIERVRVVFISDANTVLANLLSGAVHIAADTSVGFQQGLTAKREWAANNGGTLLYTTDLWRASYFQFRPEMVTPRALQDVRVRRALAHSLDKQVLNDTLYEAEGVMTDTLLPTTVDYYPTIDRAVVKYPFDLRRTEQLMTEAGFSRGADGIYTHPTQGRLSIELKINASPQYEVERGVMASGWRQAGFDIQEATLPAAQAQDGQARASYPGLYAFSTGLGESALPNFAEINIPRPENRWTGNNRGGWINPQYDRVLDAYNTTLDHNERISQMGQMMRLVSEELPAISLYYDLSAVPHVAAVKGPRLSSYDSSGLIAWNVHEWDLP